MKRLICLLLAVVVLCGSAIAYSENIICITADGIQPLKVSDSEMKMSETVLVALITFASGFCGSIAGLLSARYAARISAETQLKQTVVQEFAKKRADAFTEVFCAHAAVIASPESPECVIRLRTAIESACVVASPDTTARLLIFQDAIASHNDSRISSAKTDLAIAMQKDLVVFTKPKLEENRW